MAFGTYRDFVMAAGAVKRDIRGVHGFSVHVLSPTLFLVCDLGTGAVLFVGRILKLGAAQAVTRIRAIDMTRGGLVAPLLHLITCLTQHRARECLACGTAPAD